MSLFDDLDELASAYLDGETTPEETARVEADPLLVERVEELRLISEAAATPVTPPPEAARESAIAAALAAFDVDLTASPTEEPTAEPAVSARATDTQGAEPAVVKHQDAHHRSGASFRPAGAPRTTSRASRWERFAKVGPMVAAAFVGIFAIGLVLNAINSGESVDTASTATGSASDAVADAAGDAAELSEAEALTMDDAMSDSAMSDDAMDDSATSEEASGDSGDDIDASAANVAGEASAADSAMEEAMEEAMEDDAMSEGAMAADAENEFGARTTMDFAMQLGRFDNAEALAESVVQMDLVDRSAIAVEFADCADLIDELTANGATVTIIGTATLNALDDGEAPPLGQSYTVLRQDVDNGIFSIVVSLDPCALVSSTFAAN